MSAQVGSIVTTGLNSAAKCERCRRDRKKCVKGVVGMTGCKRCTYLGYECGQSTDVVQQPYDHSATALKKVSAMPTTPQLQKQIDTIATKFRGVSVDSVSSEDEKDVLANNTRTAAVEPVTTSENVPPTNTAPKSIEGKILQQFKTFTEVERERLQERKRERAKQDRAMKLQDLQRFAQNFNLKSPMPSDLVSILAKDPNKQQAIVDKAKHDQEEAKKETAKPPQVAPDASVSHVRTPVKPSSQTTPRKSTAIIIKTPAGEVVDFTKRLSSTPIDSVRTAATIGTSGMETQVSRATLATDAAPVGGSSTKNPTTNVPARPEISSSYLYVKGIDGKVTEDLLRQIFEIVGPTESIRIFRDPDPQNKNFAYVRYHDTATATRAMTTLDGRRIHDAEIQVELLIDPVVGTKGPDLRNGKATHTPLSRMNPTTPASRHRPVTSDVSNQSSTPNLSRYVPTSGSSPYASSLMYTPASTIAQRLDMLFTITSLTTNQLLRRNIDFDGYISIRVFTKYHIQLGLPSTANEWSLGYAANYYCLMVECGTNSITRCCLRLRNPPATLLASHSQRQLEFPCPSRGKHVARSIRTSGLYGTYSALPPMYLAQSSPYASYSGGSAYYTPIYTPYTPSYTNGAVYGQIDPLQTSLYPLPLPSSINYGSNRTTSQGHLYGNTNLYNDATAVFGNIYQNHNYYSQNNQQAQNTSADDQEQFIEQVLNAAAKFGISTPQVPTVKSKDEVSRWIRDVYEAQLEASTVWGGSLSIVPPSNATSLEPLDLATEYGSSRPVSPRPEIIDLG